MNRRNLLRKLGIGTGAVAAGTVAGLAASVAKGDVKPEFDFDAYMKYSMELERQKYADLGPLPIVFVDGPWAGAERGWTAVAHTGDTIHIPSRSRLRDHDKYLMTLAASRTCYYAEYQAS